ncbi:hypothetical protein GWO43_01270 [candidate division KSB1 bacterium]|nr:hypothetical protein [candidate division KSB1 bacterium]NIS22701.1 hypothetical protein [candidate division KSB1 bacterium]NIT69549.1 hypothetical protein [candidate division KSB1 bacterium]NIU23203.1 hypothetical protein [candidate division KSB1 bacterium]NIU90365.1 hypothetical protein [candidate division KSB1 bacterium]
MPADQVAPETKPIEPKPKQEKKQQKDRSTLPFGELTAREQLECMANLDTRVLAIAKAKDERLELQVQSIGFLAVIEAIEKVLKK